MIAREIVSTCSNPHVARAAVASIGGDFAGWLHGEASSRNLSSGLFAAGLVREFALGAQLSDWEGLRKAILGADMPILAGLRYILEREAKLEADDAPPARLGAPPPPIFLREPSLCYA